MAAIVVAAGLGVGGAACRNMGRASAAHTTRAVAAARPGTGRGPAPVAAAATDCLLNPLWAFGPKTGSWASAGASTIWVRVGLHEILRESRTSDLGFGGPRIGSTTAHLDAGGDTIILYHLFAIH